MPLSAIADEFVHAEIVGRVEGIAEQEPGLFEVRISLAAQTVGGDPGQLINMLFGNTSLHDDVTLHDVALPAELVKGFGGPRHGLHELRRRVGAPARALTCSALKPQGLPPPGSRISRCVSHAAASTTSRTIMAWPTRPIRHFARASTPLRRRCGLSSRAARRCAMCRASRAISTPCASRSTTPAAPALIPSWLRR